MATNSTLQLGRPRLAAGDVHLDPGLEYKSVSSTADIRKWQAAALLATMDSIPAISDSRKMRALRSFVRGTLLDEGEIHVPEVRVGS